MFWNVLQPDAKIPHVYSGLPCLTPSVELSQVKLKAMKSHEEQVTQLSEQVAALHADGGIVESVQGDLERLNTRWTDTFEKLGELSFKTAACGHVSTGLCYLRLHLHPNICSLIGCMPLVFYHDDLCLVAVNLLLTSVISLLDIVNVCHTTLLSVVMSCH